MTVSILRALARLPDGQQGDVIELVELGAVLRDKLKLGATSEQQRNARHALGDRLYRDGGDADMAEVIDAVFEDKNVRDKRKAVIPYTKYGNALKRVVGELSTVYATPARRYVGGGEANQGKYDAVIKALCFDEQMGVVNEMLNLHRALIVGPRVRRNADDTRTLVLDIATPATVRAVCNPLDTTQVLAWLISVDMPMVHNPWSAVPAWILWSDHEYVYLDERLNPIAQTYKEHELGINRWVPISYSSTSIPGFWPGSEGDDLIAAQLALWLTAILMLKETKSNTKQPLISGDTSTMARAQASDSDVPIEAPEGVTVTTIDVGTDPEVFILASDHILERVGNNYGLSMAALKHQGVQSADAREAMMAPVRERRGKQRKIFRRFEERLVGVIARVLEKDARDHAFDPVDWRINFGETQVLLSMAERLALFEKLRQFGLTNGAEFLMTDDEDMTEESAMLRIAHNIELETLRISLMRDQMALSGEMGGNAARAESGETANGGRPAAEPDPDDDAEPDMAWVEGVLDAA